LNPATFWIPDLTLKGRERKFIKLLSELSVLTKLRNFTSAESYGVPVDTGIGINLLTGTGTVENMNVL
jgi:hypothetical protein